MIRFEGKISGKTKSKAKKKIVLLYIFVAILMFAMGIIPYIMGLDYLMLKIAFLGGGIGGGIFCLIFPFMVYKSMLPGKIELEDGIVEYVSVDGKSSLRSVDGVKKVVDEGSYYHIKFSFPIGMAICFCQKDLLVEGTIEEFEKLFEGKIVRKTK